MFRFPPGRRTSAVAICVGLLMLALGSVGSSAHAQTNPRTFDGNTKCSDLGMAGLKIDTENLENGIYAAGGAHVEITGSVPDGLQIHISGVVDDDEAKTVTFSWAATLDGQPFHIDRVLTKAGDGGLIWTYAQPGATSGTAWTNRDSISHVEFCLDTNVGGTTTGGTTTGGTTTGGTTTGADTTGGTTTGGTTTGGTTTGGATTGGATTGGTTTGGATTGGATTGGATTGGTGTTTGGATTGGTTTGGATTGGTIGATTGAATTGPTDVEGEVIARPVTPAPVVQAPASQAQGRVAERQLPRTGGNDWTLSALGVLLVVGGATTLVLRNRFAAQR